MLRSFLDGNRITVVTGLSGLPLQELHVAHQTFAHASDCLRFDAETLRAIAKTLTVVNAAGNRLEDVSPLTALSKLETLSLGDNRIRDMMVRCDSPARLRMHIVLSACVCM